MSVSVLRLQVLAPPSPTLEGVAVSSTWQCEFLGKRPVMDGMHQAFDAPPLVDHFHAKEAVWRRFKSPPCYQLSRSWQDGQTTTAGCPVHYAV